jgi:hypothetical protein
MIGGADCAADAPVTEPVAFPAVGDVAELIERLRNFDMVNHGLHDELPELLITAASSLAALQQRVEELERALEKIETCGGLTVPS